jgi:penicillin-binding protein 2
MYQPKIAIAVFIENAKGGGGLWAAPTAGLMIEKYLTRKISEKERERTILDANFSY